MRLYLIRHAEPTLAGRFIGTTDPPLSERGHRQAADVLRPLAADHVYVSPRRRARETAAYLAAPHTVIEELGEIDFGAWEGLTWAEILERDPERAERKLQDWFRVPPPGGESWEQLLDRVDVALETIRQGAGTIAVVAHAVVNAAIHSRLTGQDPAHFRQQYVEIATYDL